mmetsp:Transcript_69212/g.225441  ORF Transcript_69212/g.225441 Transcript_69212/m.225441 type:complete len:348 (+) Transcript_69212:79-1122(+)|eukprot:CAMPEP_0203948942 /NCGR_PEP_ID=MMETSP0359-20131031/83477_1 /ASSEMBLY_ACC=CAM_ASM_000338 /TAXON_ID=268821 /ORGANISM="Scrippsiella Hangoei, Strain SHTV-5" /LENGTH=347 /DNA_ID=CAMNT_0050880693 /DNA_START=79 /DNA_END=1122 /DNA_ORIENTATION=-
MAAVDKTRIQGFGSDGSTTKTWRCPAGHMLCPLKAEKGKCDGCKRQVVRGDTVMDCRACNWYLCQDCHPQEKQVEDWLWGSISYFVEQATQELAEISTEVGEMAGEFENFCSDAFKQGGCSVTDGKQFDRDEMRFGGKEPRSSAPEKPQKKAAAKKSQDKQRSATNAKPERARQQDDDAAFDEEGGRAAARAPGTAQAAAKEDAKAAAEPEDTASECPPAAEQVQKAPAPPPEDLLDIGQNDLLDIDSETAAAAAAARGPEAPPVDLFGAAPAAEMSAFGAITKGAETDLLDLDFGGAPAPAASAPAAAAELDIFGACADFVVAAPAAAPQVPLLPPPPANVLPDLI